MANQIIGNRDISNIFTEIGKTKKVTFKNLTGAELTLVGGEVIGTIKDAGANDGKSVMLVKAATNGSQFPVGVNMSDVTLANNAEFDITIVISGGVSRDKLIFVAGTAITDAISLRTIEDRLGSDTLGIKVESVTELTKYDNQ